MASAARRPLPLPQPLPRQAARRRAGGFSLVEVMVSLAILAALLVIGVPAMSGMIKNSKLDSMADFYISGLKLARSGAIQKSAAARFVMTGNANGQYDWTVDWCFPTSTDPCDNTGNWSTAAAAATGDTNVANPSLSIVRSASGQPGVDQLAITITPANGLVVYFNSRGWVNTNVQPSLAQLCFDAVDGACVNLPATPPEIRPRAIAVTLSGVAERCDPLVGNTDSRTCSP
ncbi:MAG: prepilin-type N-terminal cleavage/methylation domain-containing protein [Sterolibacterium sp.]|nr:prepilin-type N-terminal cleavage/methylation domain-containing protein [Sterolibacterium sp.]